MRAEPVADGHQPLGRLGDGGVGVAGGAPGALGDRLGGRDEPAEDRVARHDAGVVGGVGGGRHGQLDLGQEQQGLAYARGVGVYGDGGGKAPLWPAPIAGVERVGRLLVGLGPQIEQFGLTIEPHAINAQPGAIVRDRDGWIVFVFALDIEGSRVWTVRSIINPDKLQHLGPVADVRAALQASGGRESVS